MDAKLTLKLDKFVIEEAKKYAASQKRSLSRIIESYLKSLVTSNEKIDEGNIEISPFVKSMETGKKIPTGWNYRKEVVKHLESKHK